MKRLPENSRGYIASRWVEKIVNCHLPRDGQWNLDKILDEIERLLRNRRRGRKSAGASTKDSGSPATSTRPPSCTDEMAR
jgi:hypothetical protein